VVVVEVGVVVVEIVVVEEVIVAVVVEAVVVETVVVVAVVAVLVVVVRDVVVVTVVLTFSEQIVNPGGHKFWATKFVEEYAVAISFMQTYTVLPKAAKSSASLVLNVMPETSPI
jgi:hypothetical protein